MFGVVSVVLVLLMVLLLVTFAAYAICCVAEHAKNHPQAYKLLYLHVFLPVFVGPEKSAAIAALENQEPVDLSAIE